MRKKMEQVTVELAGDGQIRISGPDYGDGAESVYLMPEQVDTVIEWLREAQKASAQAEEVG